ncbi:hypothetical protein [Propionivibrio limicola]|uniref:hypothetical protein n=1 Tax=Propionivibrio limicola TaxID=167645 RepID=UPI001292B2CF|nr:hypothetical protein [Propionivibrio limicola]
MILNFFSSRPDHPLGEPKELKRVLAEVPRDNSFKAVDEIHGWLESLLAAEGFRASQLFDVVRQLDEAAQPHLRRLARDYLQTGKQSKSEERQRWTMSYNYWGEVASLYALCIDMATRNPKERGNDAFKSSLPLAATRLMAARTAQLKWVEFRYGRVGEDLWRGLGQPYLAAEAAGYAQKSVQLYPGQSAVTSVAQQYLQALVLRASSMGSLRPLEIELADWLVAHFLPLFAVSQECQPHSVYWIDAANGTPPIRLARLPGQLGPTIRFFSPGEAPQALSDLMHRVERGEMPSDLNLGGEFPARTVLPVLRHLAVLWSPAPKVRAHPRHPVKTRMAVLHGFDDCFTVFAGNLARLGKERSAESWVVENVSMGGFGAAADDVADWLGVGVLLCLQPEGGDNWVLGVVRRIGRDDDGRVSVGIQTLARQAAAIELRPRSAGFSATGAIPGILLKGAAPAGEARVVLPVAGFDLRENMEFIDGDQRCVLSPVEQETGGASFEIGRFREEKMD